MRLFYRVMVSAWLSGMLFFSGCHRHDVSQLDVESDNEGCANGAPIRLTGTEFQHEGVLGDLMGAAYFRFDVPEDGTWLLLETQNEIQANFSFNAVISVLSGDGERLLASVDDNFIWSSGDPSFMYRAASAGDICIKIETYQGWTQSTLGSGEVASDLLYYFRLAMNPADSVFYDVEPDDTIDNSVNIQLSEVDETEQQYGWINGALDTPTDVDKYAFTTGDQPMVGEVYLNMASGSGNPLLGISGTGTTASLLLEISDASGQILAGLEMAGNNRIISSLLEPNTQYFLTVKGAPQWQPDVNDYYSLLIYNTVQSDYWFEPIDENDSIAAAGQLPLEQYFDGYRYGTVWGTIDSSTDVDVFYLDIDQGQYVLLNCRGKSLGSGLTEFTVSLLDSGGGEIQSSTEGDIAIEWSTASSATNPLILTSRAGPHYLRIDSSHSDDASSRLYICTVNSVEM